MDTLPRTLAAALPDGTIRTSTPVRRIHRPDSVSPWRVELLSGLPIEASAVVLATEAHASARLVDGFDSDLALQLRSIPYASSVIVNVAYRRDQVAHPLDGFGAVVPAIEGRSILAVSFLSVKFPGRAPPGRSSYESSSAARPSLISTSATTPGSGRSFAKNWATCSVRLAIRSSWRWVAILARCPSTRSAISTASRRFASGLPGILV